MFLRVFHDKTWWSRIWTRNDVFWHLHFHLLVYYSIQYVIFLNPCREFKYKREENTVPVNVSKIDRTKMLSGASWLRVNWPRVPTTQLFSQQLFLDSIQFFDGRGPSFLSSRDLPSNLQESRGTLVHNFVCFGLNLMRSIVDQYFLGKCYLIIRYGVLHVAMVADERWGAGVETQKNVRGEVGGWGRVPFNEPYAPSLSTIYDGA